MTKCGFKEIRKDRAYYDLEHLIEIHDLNINIASGYQASLGKYSDRILLSTELANKLLNSQTVLQVMENSVNYNGIERARDDLTNKLIGQTVMTK